MSGSAAKERVELNRRVRWLLSCDGLEGCRVLNVVGGFELGRCGVAGVVGDLAVKVSVVEPVDVGHRRELDIIDAAPRPLRVDEISLVEPVEGLGHRVVGA
jgi:hypothetical protein